MGCWGRQSWDCTKTYYAVFRERDQRQGKKGNKVVCRGASMGEQVQEGKRG